MIMKMNVVLQKTKLINTVSVLNADLLSILRYVKHIYHCAVEVKTSHVYV